MLGEVPSCPQLSLPGTGPEQEGTTKRSGPPWPSSKRRSRVRPQCRPHRLGYVEGRASRASPRPSLREVPRCNDGPPLGLVRQPRSCDQYGHAPGCIVECGVWRGGMSAGMAEVLGPGRSYCLFDSFEGLPPADGDKDGELAVAWQANGRHNYNNCRADIDEAAATMSRAGVVAPQLIQGWFKDTLPGFVPPSQSVSCAWMAIGTTPPAFASRPCILMWRPRGWFSLTTTTHGVAAPALCMTIWPRSANRIGAGRVPEVWPTSSRAEQLLPAHRGLSRRPNHEPEAAARSDGPVGRRPHMPGSLVQVEHRPPPVEGTGRLSALRFFTSGRGWGRSGTGGANHPDLERPRSRPRNRTRRHGGPGPD